MSSTINLFPKVEMTIQQVLKMDVPANRKSILQPLIQAVQQKLNKGEAVNLNFICTHNSRRSQLAQVWAEVATTYFDLDVYAYSGGVEVTAFNERAIASLERMGFEVMASPAENPIYNITFTEEVEPIMAFSKLYDDETNEIEQFLAVMTCTDADDNCPHIPQAEQRIAVRYEDPKKFDNTPSEAKMYDQRSLQIASEMFYVFGQLV